MKTVPSHQLDNAKVMGLFIFNYFRYTTGISAILLPVWWDTIYTVLTFTNNQKT